MAHYKGSHLQDLLDTGIKYVQFKYTSFSQLNNWWCDPQPSCESTGQALEWQDGKVGRAFKNHLLSSNPFIFLEEKWAWRRRIKFSNHEKAGLGGAQTRVLRLPHQLHFYYPMQLQTRQDLLKTTQLFSGRARPGTPAQCQCISHKTLPFTLILVWELGFCKLVLFRLQSCEKSPRAESSWDHKA